MRKPYTPCGIKAFRLHGFDIHGIDMKDDGIDIEQVQKSLSEKEFDFAYLIPSYHNPTGIVTSSEKRAEIIRLFHNIKFNCGGWF